MPTDPNRSLLLPFGPYSASEKKVSFFYGAFVKRGPAKQTTQNRHAKKTQKHTKHVKTKKKLKIKNAKCSQKRHEKKKTPSFRCRVRAALVSRRRSLAACRYITCVVRDHRLHFILPATWVRGRCRTEGCHVLFEFAIDAMTRAERVS